MHDFKSVPKPTAVDVFSTAFSLSPPCSVGGFSCSPRNRVSGWTLIQHRWLLLALFCSVACLGCESRYEERLNKSVAYFEFLDKLNQSLSEETWSSNGITLQVPQDFRLLSPPEAAVDAQGNPVALKIDPRQPDFIPGGLPGLVGAWERQVPTTGNQMATANIYVISNYSLWEPPAQPANAVTFHNDSANQIFTSLGVQPPTPGQWTDETIPNGKSYINKKTYRKITLPMPKPINGFPHDISIYQTTSADMQASLIAIVPQNIAGSINLVDLLRTSLMTLNVSGARPDGGTTTTSEPEADKKKPDSKPPEKKNGVNF